MLNFNLFSYEISSCQRSFRFQKNEKNVPVPFIRLHTYFYISVTVKVGVSKGSVFGLFFISIMTKLVAFSRKPAENFTD